MLIINQVYVDNSATTKISKVVLDRMMPYLKENYGNASQEYNLGKISKEAIENARQEIAKLLNVNTKEIYFTSSGTESDNLAILGLARANKSKGRHIITTSIEHKAVLNSMKELEKEGFSVTYLPVDKGGKIDVATLKNSITKDTILISIMLVNNEIGSIQDIESISRIAKNNGVIFHTDATQAAPHMKLDGRLCDAMSFSAHKFQGPKGVGVLYLKENLQIDNIKYGGGQEKGLIPGTENVASIVGAAEAFKNIQENINGVSKKEKVLYDYIIAKLQKIPGFVLNGKIEDSINSIINFYIDGINTQDLKLYLEMNGICISSGSACNSSSKELSHVLKAIGNSTPSIRISINYQNTLDEMDYIYENIIRCINFLNNK